MLQMQYFIEFIYSVVLFFVFYLDRYDANNKTDKWHRPNWPPFLIDNSDNNNVS